MTVSLGLQNEKFFYPNGRLGVLLRHKIEEKEDVHMI